jgi:hypothetical protein
MTPEVENATIRKDAVDPKLSAEELVEVRKAEV